MLSVLSKLFQLTPYATSASQEISRHITNIAKISTTAVSTFTQKAASELNDTKYLSDLYSSATNLYISAANLVKYPFYQGFYEEKDPESLKKNICALQCFGAKEDYLTSKDGAKIHYIHAKGSDFQKTIQNARGESAEIILPNGTNIAAIAIPQNNKQVKDSIDRLNAITPFATFFHDKKFFLLPESDYNLLKELKLVGDGAQGSNLLNYSTKAFKPAATKSSVVICGGIESQAACRTSTTQIFAYLLAGYEDIITFDYRGSGKSKGIISEEGIDMDLQEIYSYLQLNGVKNENLIVEGDCFGAGPATRFAKNNPGVNLRLYSPYVSSQKLAEDMVEGSGGSKLSQMFKNAYAYLAGCKYDVRDDLKFVTGHIQYITNDTDELINKKHDIKNLRALGIKDPLKEQIVKRNDQLIHVSHVSGIRHGANWFAKADGNTKAFKPVNKFTGLAAGEKEVSFGTEEIEEGWIELPRDDVSLENKGMQGFVTFNEKAGLGSPIFALPSLDLEVVTQDLVEEGTKEFQEMSVQDLAKEELEEVQASEKFSYWENSASRTSTTVISLFEHLSKMAPSFSSYLEGSSITAAGA